MKRVCCYLLFTLFSITAFGKITFPALVGDNMVLQQKSDVVIWGSSDQKKIAIITSWDKKNYKVFTGSDGAWRLTIHTPGAGGPYQISFNDGEQVILNNILIGEVWLCSGQSNMDMAVKGRSRNEPVLNSADILKEAKNPQIRLFKLVNGPSVKIENACRGKWQLPDSASVNEFSAVGYLYAKLLQEHLKVPVGIIQSCWGGSRIEAWMSESSLSAFPEITVMHDTAMKKGVAMPATLYNSRIAPITNYRIKGILWYQGESSCDRYPAYDRMMAAMVADWKNVWKQQDIPFYYVQIAPYTYADSKADYRLMVPYFREAQQKALSLIPNSAMVGTIDVGSEKTVHAPDKLTVSKRLTSTALALTYHVNNVPYLFPAYKSVKFDNNTATISIDNCKSLTRGESLENFQVAGADHVFYPVAATISGSKIIIHSDKVEKILSVRYGFKAWVKGDVFNDEGLPLLPFRTDNWTL
jgi:sialate O-acetylesterase